MCMGGGGCFTIYPACPNKSYFCTKEKERNQHLCKKRCSICIIEHNLTRNYFVYFMQFIDTSKWWTQISDIVKCDVRVRWWRWPGAGPKCQCDPSLANTRLISHLVMITLIISSTPQLSGGRPVSLLSEIANCDPGFRLGTHRHHNNVPE